MDTKIEASDFPGLWANYIINGELEKVIGLYNDQSLLLPTFSPNAVNNQVGLTDYFTRLASRSGLNVKLHHNTVSTYHVCAETYILSGIYSFEFEIDATLLTFPSRFTFVIDLEREHPILHHHSSQIPRTLT